MIISNQNLQWQINFRQNILHKHVSFTHISVFELKKFSSIFLQPLSSHPLSKIGADDTQNPFFVVIKKLHQIHKQ